MKFLYKDLLKFLNIKPSKKEISEKLFQLGHEHEISGEIFDLDVTPNRGDCLSLLGLSRDLNFFFGNKEPYKIFSGKIPNLKIDFSNLSPRDCPQISFLEIEIEGEISSYKSYLERYFSKLGNNKVNFFTDISNYLSYEVGQPTHCYDANTIKSKITFEKRVCKEKFLTLLDTSLNLEGENCVFVSNNKVINLAGIMGGRSTSCKSDTYKVLVECAFFRPEAISGKALKYNIDSDAAYKFERGVDISSQEKVLRRFIQIVKDHASVKNLKIKSFTNYKNKSNSLTIDINKINKILGSKISKDEYLNCLFKLGFNIQDKVNIPAHRHDIFTQNDLAEEIARLRGYNNINAEPLVIKHDSKVLNDDINKIRYYLANNGFAEVINFPFTSKKNKRSLSIDNPLDLNKRYLRVSLQESLIENLLYNERRQKDSIKLFEISDLYLDDYSNKSKRFLGIIISGRTGNNYRDFSKKLDRKYLDNLFNVDSLNNEFHIEEISRANLKTKKKDKIFYIEIEINDISKVFFKKINFKHDQKEFIKYQPISEFPASIRDFSFSITDTKNFQKVIDHMSTLCHENLKESFIFDFYKNNDTNEIKVGFRLIFQSNLKTLSEEDIQKSINIILAPVLKLEGISIPGLIVK